MISLTKPLIFISIASVALPAFATTSAITRLSFITEQRVVAPGDTSGVITVQTQNATGGEEKLDETGHLTFVSTSATGEFLGSTGKPVTTTMSKGTANRSFYYHDTTPGTYTITVTVSTGDSFSWKSTQTIIVGSQNTENVSDTVSSRSAPIPAVNDASFHSSPAELSQSIKIFHADAGRERSVHVHTPVHFEATKESPYGVYRWSFGDGGAGSGNRVTHTYLEPGIYVVVLNADFNGKQETSRTLVEVSTPSISILPGVWPHTFMLHNADAHEVNVGGWVVRSSEKITTIPDDTILLPGQHLTVTIENGVADSGDLFNVQYPDGATFAYYNGPQLAQVVQSVHAVLTRTTQRSRESSPQVETSIVTPPSISTSTQVVPIIFPPQRSWWQLFIETVFAH